MPHGQSPAAPQSYSRERHNEKGFLSIFQAASSAEYNTACGIICRMIGTELVTPREYAKKKMFGQFAEQAKSSTVPVEFIPAQRKVQERHLPYGLDSVSADAVQAWPGMRHRSRRIVRRAPRRRWPALSRRMRACSRSWKGWTTPACGDAARLGAVCHHRAVQRAQLAPRAAARGRGAVGAVKEKEARPCWRG
jgi:hypothetical protein